MSLGSNVRTRTVWCDAMGNVMLFLLTSRLFLYSAGSGVIRVQVVLSGFGVRLVCFVQANTLCRYGCMYILAALVLVYIDVVTSIEGTRWSMFPPPWLAFCIRHHCVQDLVFTHNCLY